jgi:hypothetical protein
MVWLDTVGLDLYMNRFKLKICFALYTPVPNMRNGSVNNMSQEPGWTTEKKTEEMLTRQ